jgi:predicted membrane protein (TIGR00267 family)
MSPIKRLAAEWQKLRYYSELSEVGEIARRYFAMNAFDGILTITGVLAGSFAARVVEPAVIATTGLSTAAAMGISGLWGAALTETAERRRALNELEQATLSSLRGTQLAKASRFAIGVVALADALAPVISATLVLTPFFLAGELIDLRTAYLLAFGMAFAMLFALGAFLGAVARQNLVVAGLKTLSAGLLSLGFGLLLHPASL